MWKPYVGILCGLVMLSASTSVCAAIQLQPVVTGLSNPLYVTHARDGSNRLFIVEQAGRILVLQPGSTTPTIFLDITVNVLSGGERGLLGLTFHPAYTTNRRFFVNYTRQPDGATVIAEYQRSATDPNVADPTETPLLTVAQPFANHNGGMVEFGPDGFLYIGMGDGGSANDPDNRAQNINELLGKMLRIDVDRANGAVPYSSPSDNPFIGATPGRDEIYAVGLRNPFRFSFDRVTGLLYAGDVGQGAREEVDIITRGDNYGWRVFEGTLCTNNDPTLCNPGNFIPPIAEYDHSLGRCSIIGGYVYRGAKGTLPAGAYIYGDLCTGEIFQLLPAAGGGTQQVLVGGRKISKETAEAIEAGNAAMSAQNWEGARENYVKALAELPDNTALVERVAVAYLGEGNKDEALRYARMASEMAPADPQPWQIIAELEIERGNAEAGLAALDRVPAEKIIDPVLYLNAGIILYNKKKLDEAVTAFDKAIAVKPDPTAHYYRGLAELQQKKNAAARADFQKALELAPDGPDAKDIKDLLKPLP